MWGAVWRLLLVLLAALLVGAAAFGAYGRGARLWGDTSPTRARERHCRARARWWYHQRPATQAEREGEPGDLAVAVKRAGVAGPLDDGGSRLVLDARLGWAPNARSWVVTALYDIGREQRGDGRSFECYLGWFADTLRLRAPMVVFVEPAMAGWVRAKRARCGLPTIVCAQPWAATPGHARLAAFRALLGDPGFRRRLAAPDDLAFRMPEYLAVIYSKFGWAEQALELIGAVRPDWGGKNGGGRVALAWMDAGVSRFWRGQDTWAPALSRLLAFDPDARAWPHPSVTRAIARSGRVWLQASPEAERPEALSVAAQRRHIGGCHAFFSAAVLAADAPTWRWLRAEIDDILLNEMLKEGLVDTEQVALQLAWARNPQRFRLVVPRDWENLWGLAPHPKLVPLWQAPLAGRSLPDRG
jgi:hypothetical protein